MSATSTPDLTRITGLLLSKALDRRPELTHDGVRWSLSDAGDQRAILWRRDLDTDEWHKVARAHLTVDVRHLAVVVGDAGDVEIVLAVTPR